MSVALGIEAPLAFLRLQALALNGMACALKAGEWQQPSHAVHLV